MEQIIVIGLMCCLWGPEFVHHDMHDMSRSWVPVVGGILFIGGVIRRAKRIALGLAMLGVLGAIAEPILFFMSKNMNDPRIILELALAETMFLSLGCCSIDLWSEWSRPNKAPQSTTTAVTPPAAQEARQP
jgi:hypothetical protein